MIFIDDREGSKELYPRINSEYNPLLVRLDFADFMFDGNGPEGLVQVGVERKVIGDLLSSISTGRLVSHQLPGLLKDYYKVYLVVEGMWRPGEGDVLEVYKGKWYPLSHGRRYKYQEIIGFVNSLAVSTGVVTIFTKSMRETALMLEALYRWWGKGWEEHRAHAEMSSIVPPNPFVSPCKPPLVRRIAAELPGVGWERSVHVADKFETVEKMVAAGVDDWMDIKWVTGKGRNMGFGKVTAKQAWDALHGEGGE